MTNRPTRASAAGRAYLELRKAASSTGRPTDELLPLYALEGLLDRLSGSPHASRFVLKGGALLAVFDVRRPTRDVDLAAIDVNNDLDERRGLVNEIIAVPVDGGLAFDTTATTAQTIRDDELYGGARVTIHGMLSTAIIQFNVDINVGDPLWPAPDEIAVPRLLGGPPIRIRGYRIELVLAETSTKASSSSRSDGSLCTGRLRSVRSVRYSPATRKWPSNTGERGVASNDSPTRHPPSSAICSTPS